MKEFPPGFSLEIFVRLAHEKACEVYDFLYRAADDKTTDFWYPITIDASQQILYVKRCFVVPYIFNENTRIYVILGKDTPSYIKEDLYEEIKVSLLNSKGRS